MAPMPTAKEIRIAVPGAAEVSGLLLRPITPSFFLVLAHGAGAGMRHAFMEALSGELAAANVATLRYQFPYMEQDRKSPDRPNVLTATVQAAMTCAAQAMPGVPLFAGGKSMGGRMSSQAASLGLLPQIRGIVFFGFPLHPPKQPGIKRADHLAKVPVPMLFLQGTRDTLADLSLLRPITANLGKLATLHILDTADHSFHVLKKSGRSDLEILRELAQTTASWATNLQNLQI